MSNETEDALRAEIERLRRDCAEAYQVVGAGMWGKPCDYFQWDVERALDNLLAAAEGKPRPHDDLLPWPKPEWQATSASEATAQSADPLDTPLPCDITVGHGTMRKGVKLGTLVLRMKVLYSMAGLYAMGARDAISQAALDVLAERQRQISAEGWEPEHDDSHGLVSRRGARDAGAGHLVGET